MHNKRGSSERLQDAEGRLDAPKIRNIALEKTCNYASILYHFRVIASCLSKVADAIVWLSLYI